MSTVRAAPAVAARGVHIVEVGPRDGLQNEPGPVSLDVKRSLIERLAAAGLREIEAGAFVSARRVPQMADSGELLRALQFGPARLDPGIALPVLTPNLQGYEAARAAGARRVAVFAAASETFSQRNIQCSIAQSLERFAPVLAAARADGVPVRGYLSCVVACPYEGAVAPAAVAGLAARLRDMGCCEISLGDTIGVATPATVTALVEAVARRVPVAELAGHFHDTYGMGVANAHAAYRLGVRTFDASIAGLGGCPYAPGASGNVATEDLVYLFDGMGVPSGVDRDALIACADWIRGLLGGPPRARARVAASDAVRSLLAARPRARDAGPDVAQ
jgi:hydroxymethylglutaryl-CoA lyase